MLYGFWKEHKNMVGSVPDTREGGQMLNLHNQIFLQGGTSHCLNNDLRAAFVHNREYEWRMVYPDMNP
jgi:hypothetical protein